MRRETVLTIFDLLIIAGLLNAIITFYAPFLEPYKEWSVVFCIAAFGLRTWIARQGGANVMSNPSSTPPQSQPPSPGSSNTQISGGNSTIDHSTKNNGLVIFGGIAVLALVVIMLGRDNKPSMGATSTITIPITAPTSVLPSATTEPTLVQTAPTLAPPMLTPTSLPSGRSYEATVCPEQFRNVNSCWDDTSGAHIEWIPDGTFLPYAMKINITPAERGSHPESTVWHRDLLTGLPSGKTVQVHVWMKEAIPEGRSELRIRGTNNSSGYGNQFHSEYWKPTAEWQEYTYFYPIDETQTMKLILDVEGDDPIIVGNIKVDWTD
jgi:hypothetical protein